MQLVISERGYMFKYKMTGKESPNVNEKTDPNSSNGKFKK